MQHNQSNVQDKFPSFGITSPSYLKYNNIILASIVIIEIITDPLRKSVELSVKLAIGIFKSIVQITNRAKKNLI